MENSSTISPVLANRYQLQQTLGKGGTAVVYRAWDQNLKRTVAIKILRSEFSKTESFRERFRQEALAAANLSHPNIITTFDFGLDNDRLFMVMEHVPGTDLKTLLRQHGPFSTAEALPLIIQACAGIGYAHRAGLVHCDVKPQNLLVTPDLRLKVTDFGIARALASIRPDEQHDIVWGSPQYFSPEQAAGLAPSPASDVYSLGVILYELLTGQLPFNSEDPAELSRMHRDLFPLPPRQLVPAIPAQLESIILKILAKEPTSRYRNADQLGRILLPLVPLSDPYSANIPPIGSQPALDPSLKITNSNQSHSQTQPSKPRENQSVTPDTSADNGIRIEPQFDWITISLSLAAILFVGGLIPFWMYIGLSIFPLR
jgi:serine/threonine protein kinase